jgi:putative ATP-dependent endonuclease of OLD family
MRITRLAIQSFRNFRDLVIDPFPTPAVIVGENGSGKTNILHALRLVLDPGLPDRARRLTADDLHEASGSFADAVEVSISIDLSDFDDNESAQVELDGAIISTDPYVARLTYRYAPRMRLGSDSGTAAPPALTLDDYEWGLFAGDSTTDEVRRIRDHVGITVLPALRDAEADLARYNRSPLARLLEQLPPESASLEAAHAAIDDAMDDLRRDDQIQEAERRIRARAKGMSGPQLPLDPSLGFASRRNDGLIRSLQLFIDSTRTRSVAQTSTGAANVLYLALLLESLMLRGEKDAVVDTFLAVEEPEAHLHPVLQRHLFSHLLREPARLLLTTHSPHIAAVAPLQSLVLLSIEPAGGGSNASTVSGATLSTQEIGDLERYLNVSRAEVLFSRLIILVEGISEVYILPALGRALRFDLDAHGVVVANIEGTNFFPFIQLLGKDGLRRDVIVVTDGDVTEDSEPGLKRAAGLTGDAETGARLDHAATTLGAVPLPTDGDMRSGRFMHLQLAARAGVFVGGHTLEVDLAAAVPEQLKKAFGELEERPNMVQQFNDAVDKIVQGAATVDVRKTLLRRIEDRPVGKGRFAQRLATHIESVTPDRLVEDFDPEEALTTDVVLGKPAGHLLGAINLASTLVRGHALAATQQTVAEAVGSPEVAGS